MTPSDQFRAMMNTRAISCTSVNRLIPEWSVQYIRMLRMNRATPANVERLRLALGFGMPVAGGSKSCEDGPVRSRIDTIRAAAR